MGRYGSTRTGFNPWEHQIGVENVATLQEEWTGITADDVSTSPVVAGGSVFVGAIGGEFYAFDAEGIDGCTGTPSVCEPRWTASIGGNVVLADPAVVDGTVYVTSTTGVLSAFDASGEAGCSGTPKTCTPLWMTEPLGSTNIEGAPALAGGIVYVVSGGALHAFDAAGVTNCSGAPRTCGPLWKTDGFGQASAPTIWRDFVYVGSGNTVYTYDREGVTNCSGGAPRTCTALWTAQVPCVPSATRPCRLAAPTVAQGFLYVGASQNNTFLPLDYSGGLFVFDAKGVSGCTGTPTTCTPLWSGATDGWVTRTTVANGIVFTMNSEFEFPSILTTLRAFDATGTANCTATPPKSCTPLWSSPTATVADPSTLLSLHSLTAANGVVYAGAENSAQAFDAAGTINCTGTPSMCEPIWLAPIAGGVGEDIAIVLGKLYVPGDDSRLHVYGLPA